MSMRQRSFILIASLAIGLSSVSSHAQGKVEVYGGYSYLRPAFSQTETFICVRSPCALNEVVFPPLVVTSHPNLNGWNVSGAYMVTQWLSTKADFSGNYGTSLGSSTARIHTFLFGPEVRWPGHISPFVQVLFGGAHLSSSGGTIPNIAQYNTVLSRTDSAFAVAFGGGIDAKVKSSLWARLIQLDDLVTRFQSGTQNQPRVSAGAVIRF
jgi:opacity protein-like surface antigen